MAFRFDIPIEVLRSIRGLLPRGTVVCVPGLPTDETLVLAPGVIMIGDAHEENKVSSLVAPTLGADTSMDCISDNGTFRGPIYRNGNHCTTCGCLSGPCDRHGKKANHCKGCCKSKKATHCNRRSCSHTLDDGWKMCKACGGCYGGSAKCCHCVSFRRSGKPSARKCASQKSNKSARCKVAGCQWASHHTKHYCDRCGNANADHLDKNCPYPKHPSDY